VRPWTAGLKRAASVLASASAVVAVTSPVVPAEARLPAALAFAIGAILSWRGVEPLRQLGAAAAAGALASAAGVLP
jgi:hypothetical protein